MKPDTPLESFLPYQLSIASNAVSGRIALEYRNQFGLSVPEWRVMAILGDAGAQTQRELTQRTVMDKVAVNRACKVLEERELASRTPNADDGRSHLLDLTASGKKMHGQVMPLAVSMEQQLFCVFNDEEQAQFRRLLNKLRDRVEEFDMENVESDNFGVR